MSATTEEVLGQLAELIDSATHSTEPRGPFWYQVRYQMAKSLLHQDPRNEHAVWMIHFLHQEAQQDLRDLSKRKWFRRRSPHDKAMIEFLRDDVIPRTKDPDEVARESYGVRPGILP